MVCQRSSLLPSQPLLPHLEWGFVLVLYPAGWTRDRVAQADGVSGLEDAYEDAKVSGYEQRGSSSEVVDRRN